MRALKMLAGAYLGVTSVYGSVYLSCLVVPQPVENALWFVTVDHYSGPTMIIAAMVGATLGWRSK